MLDIETSLRNDEQQCEAAVPKGMLIERRRSGGGVRQRSVWYARGRRWSFSATTCAPSKS